MLWVQFLLEDSAPFVDASLDGSQRYAEEVCYLPVGVAECVHDDRTDADALRRCLPCPLYYVLSPDCRIGSRACMGFSGRELFNECDAFLSVVLVDEHVLHHAVRETAEKHAFL